MQRVVCGALVVALALGMGCRPTIEPTPPSPPEPAPVLCIATTCQAQQKNCGSMPDGCGGMLECGSCAASETCGAGGNPNVCGHGSCTPTTCAAQGKNCGVISDGCGGTLACGSCASGEVCGASVANVCAAPSQAANRVCDPNGFCWVSPQPQGGTLRDTWGTSANDFWAVGPPHNILRWDGSKWTAYPTGSSQPLSGVWGASPSDIWAVGGRLLHWNGARWTPDPTVTSYLNDVHGSAADQVWAVGEGGKVLRWNGAAWTGVPSGTDRSLRAVWVIGPSDVWIAGDMGLIRRWNGTSWADYSLPLSTVNGLWASGPDDVWAIGDSNVYHWDGSSWTQSLMEDYASFYFITGTGPADVWVGGDLSTRHWNGQTWTREPSRAGGRFLGAWARGNDVWFVGESGSVLVSNAQGTRSLSQGPHEEVFVAQCVGANAVWLASYEAMLFWDGQTLREVPAPSFGSIYGMWSSGPRDVWAVGAYDYALHWDGNDWTRVETGLNHDGSDALWGIWGSAANDVWAVGSAGAVIHWNGSAWSRVDIGSAANLLDIWGFGPRDLWIAGRDEGGGVVLHYDGTRWTEQHGFTSLTGLWGASTNDIWTTGYDGLYHWDGRRWSHPETGRLLGRLWGASASDVYAAGISGEYAHWDGQRWTRFQGPTEDNLLGGCSSGSAHWLVGQGGVILRKQAQ